MSGFWSVVGDIVEALDAALSNRPVDPEARRGPLVRPIEDEDDWSESLREAIVVARRPAERVDRIRSEILMVAPHFSHHEGVNFDEDNCNWLEIPKYPLPEKWARRWAKLLILFPETYPLSPPIGFYLDREFRLKDGGTDGHLIGRGLHSAPDLRAHGWHWYCVRVEEGVQGGWRPSARYDQPDNLRTYLNTVREVLTND